MNKLLGAGHAYGGRSKFGYGVPASSNGISGIPFARFDGSQGTIRRIDTVKRDYVIDPLTGNMLGLNVVQQQVYLALTTNLGSAASPDLGNTLYRIQTLGNNANKEIETAIRNALFYLTSNKKIILQQINIFGDSIKTRRSIQVVWQDTSTMEIQEINI